LTLFQCSNIVLKKESKKGLKKFVEVGKRVLHLPPLIRKRFSETI